MQEAREEKNHLSWESYRLPPAVGREASFLQQMVINAETRNQGDESEWLSNAQF